MRRISPLWFTLALAACGPSEDECEARLAQMVPRMVDAREHAMEPSLALWNLALPQAPPNAGVRTGLETGVVLRIEAERMYVNRDARNLASIRPRLERILRNMERMDYEGPRVVYVGIDRSAPLERLRPVLTRIPDAYETRLVVHIEAPRRRVVAPDASGPVRNGLQNLPRDASDRFERIGPHYEQALDDSCEDVQTLFSDLAYQSDEEADRSRTQGLVTALRTCRCRGPIGDLESLTMAAMGFGTYEGRRGWVALDRDDPRLSAPDIQTVAEFFEHALDGAE